MRASACNLLVPVVSGGSRLAAPAAPGDFLSTSIGWHRTKNRNSARRSSTHGGPSSAGHAIANGVYAAVVNRVWIRRQTEKGDPGWSSGEIPLVADPFGRFFRRFQTVKKSWCRMRPRKERGNAPQLPFLRDRRIDAISPINEPLADKE